MPIGNPISFPNGFNITSQEPIDARFYQPNQASRLSLLEPNVYPGLIVYEDDTRKLFVLNDTGSPNLNSSWTEITGSSGDFYSARFSISNIANQSWLFEGDGFPVPTTTPELILVRGLTYIFYNESSVGSSPFQIQTDTPSSPVGGGTKYIPGTNNNPAAGEQALIFTVPFDAPNQLFYQSTTHPEMSGSFIILNADSLITASATGNEIEFEKANGDIFTITVDTGSFDTSSLLVTASAALNVLTFEKGNGDEFTVTIDTGSGGSGIFEQTGSFFATTNNLQITGSLTTTGSVNLALETSSTAVDKVMMYDSQSGQVFFTSSAAIGGSSVIYTGEVVTTPQTIQKIKTLDFGDDDTLVQFDINNGELTFIFGTPPTPFVNASTNFYDVDRFNLEPQSFQVRGTYNRFTSDFESASLKEILPSASLLATRQSEPPTGPLTYGMINRTGSKAGTKVQGFYGGAIEYKFQMELTSSSPINGNDQLAINQTTLSLNKVPPVVPTITHVLDAQRVIGSTTIEVGATGSFNYTASSNSNPQSGTSPRESNNFRYKQMVDDSSPSMDVLSPEGPSFGSISGSIDLENYSISQSFLVKVEAQYDSNNGQPGDFALNDPNLPVERTPPTTRGYNRVRSVRAAAFPLSQTQSIIENLDDLSLFETGFVKTGSSVFWTNSTTGNPNNVEIKIQNPGSVSHIIVIDANPSFELSDIMAGPFEGGLESIFTKTIAEDGFESPKVINGWRVYRSGKVGTSVDPLTGVDGEYTYTLKT